jgi:cyanophycinase
VFTNQAARLTSLNPHLAMNSYSNLQRLKFASVASWIAVLFTTCCVAQTFDEKFEHWPVDLKINGRIIINNGVRDFGAVKPLLVSVAEDKQVASFRRITADPSNPLAKALLEAAGPNGKFTGFSSLQIQPEKLRKALKDADVIALENERQWPSYIPQLAEFTPDFERFLEKGGTLILDRSVAHLFGNLHPGKVPDNAASPAQPGLNLLPDCVLHCEINDSEVSNETLLNILRAHPRSVGVQLKNETMLMLSGRKMSCYGKGSATFTLMANESAPMRAESITPQQSRRQSERDYLIDLTEWRRDAIDRTIEPFPLAKPKTPFIENGTLVIVGGGGMPPGLMDRLVELAGGKQNAKLIYVPCSESDEVGERQRTVESWKSSGVKHATFIHTKDRNQANTDEAFMAPLKDATGIWFGGGRQWNFADSYYGTKTHKLMKDVLRRGGVIGGSSAGASIQARYLARATPIQNFRIMAPGYERGGLGFISGVAIDQHFTQRGRQKDMTQLVNRYPQMLGIGIDEGTALVVQKSRGEVVGRGQVHFYDRNLPVVPGEPDYIALPAGSSYDLDKRKILNDTRKTPAPDNN